MEIALLLVLILLNGAFAMAEIALLTARKGRLQRLAGDGDRSALMAIRLGEEPTRFLSTLQIGITAIGISSGIIGEVSLVRPLSQTLQKAGVENQLSEVGAAIIVVTLITFLSIVIGELLPKRIGQNNAETIARFMALPVAMLARITRPFVFLLTASTEGLLRITGRSGQGNTSLTEEDIHAMLVEGAQAGVIDKYEHEMVRNVFCLDDRHIVSLMTPRSEIVYLDLNQPLEASLTYLMASKHSRFPVCRDGMRGILGVISVKRLLNHRLALGRTELVDCLVPPVFVPESLSAMKILEQFRESDVHMLFVVDEYGEVLGIVTLQDIMEVLAGGFKPHNDEDITAIQRADGSWLFDGLIPIPELKDRLGLKSVPDEGKARYHTLSGMMMTLIGGIPHTGQISFWEGWHLEVVDMDGHRIDKVLASRVKEPEV